MLWRSVTLPRPCWIIALLAAPHLIWSPALLAPADEPARIFLPHPIDQAKAMAILEKKRAGLLSSDQSSRQLSQSQRPVKVGPDDGDSPLWHNLLAAYACAVESAGPHSHLN